MFAQFIIWDVFHRMTPLGYVINIGKKCRLLYKLLYTTKTRKAVDVFNYKKQRNLLVKIKNECKREYFDKLNVKTTTKPFFGRLANHTSQTNIHMVVPKLH